MQLIKFIIKNHRRNYGIISNFFKSSASHFGKYSVVYPGNVSQMRLVPEFISKPQHYETGIPEPSPDKPEIKTDEQIKQMRASCKLAANILKEVEKYIAIGQTTDEIDELVHNLTIKNGAYPSPLNYCYFPKSVCTSVNNVACHGIPDDRKLEDGDIINVDVTVFYNGYHGDCSKTFLIGNVDQKGRDLVHATEECLRAGIEICKPGQKFSAIGTAIHQKATELKHTVIPDFLGHGIGTYFHGPPEIYHFTNDYPGIMESGMMFTIEPVIGQGSQEIKILDDNWTCITVDKSRSAQFEHTVLITNSGVEILTLPDD